MAALYTYAGATHAYPGGSGFMLCLVGPVPVGTGTGQSSTQSHGVLLQYGATKVQQPQQDDVLVLYFGRGKPAAETSGTVYFDTWTLAASWYPGALALDGVNDPHTELQNILFYCRQGFVVQFQNSQGIGNTYNGITYPAYYGRLQNPQYTFAQDGSGRVDWSATFTEIG